MYPYGLTLATAAANCTDSNSAKTAVDVHSIYLESSWSILSMIGIAQVFLGIVVLGIINKVSALSLIPIIVSGCGAIADGLCFYAYYQDWNLTNRKVAAGVGDAMWGFQEAGLSFYSYFILVKVLTGKSRKVFMSIFWTALSLTFGARVLILVYRQFQLADEGTEYQHYINIFHITYFCLIASVELVSAFFLLRRFKQAQNGAATSRHGFFRRLVRATEVRIGLLAMIGVARAITYSGQTAAQRATDNASQFDRLVYALECIFPVMLMIDLLASRLMALQESASSRSTDKAGRGNRAFPSTGYHNEQEGSQIDYDKGQRSFPMEPISVHITKQVVTDC